MGGRRGLGVIGDGGVDDACGEVLVVKVEYGILIEEKDFSISRQLALSIIISSQPFSSLGSLASLSCNITSTPIPSP